jgi:hypothetical protein
MKTKHIEGELEVDFDRGVIYFHAKHGATILRICQLGKIPRDFTFVDIINKHPATIIRPPS